MGIDAILNSEITVWVLGTADAILLTMAAVCIIRSERSTYDFERMKSRSDSRNKYKGRLKKKFFIYSKGRLR